MMGIKNLILLITCIVIFSCKRGTVNNEEVAKYKIIVNANSIILNKNSVVFISPSSDKLGAMKKKLGEDFYIIADDANFYTANATQFLDSIKVKYGNEDETKTFLFKDKNNDLVQIKKNKENSWYAILYDNYNREYEIVDLLTFSGDYKKFYKMQSGTSSSIMASEIEKKSSLNELNGLNGVWRIDCGNALTTLDISNSNAYISIYSNTVYINAQIESIPNEVGNYYIKFLNQEDTYESDGNKIDVKSISKEKSIGKLEFKNNKLMLYWYGLFNEKTKKLEYDKNTPFDIEGENKKPAILIKCD